MNIQPGSGYGFSSSAYGFTIDTGKSPFLEDLGAAAVNDHPFKVWLAGTTDVDKDGGEPGEQESVNLVRVTPGTVNNLDPLIMDVAEGAQKMTKKPQARVRLKFDESGYSYVYLECGIQLANPTIYPETDDDNAQYPLVSSYDFQVTSDDDVGALLLALVYKDPANEALTVYQYVTGSVWTDRIKLAGIDAKYYWARI